MPEATMTVGYTRGELPKATALFGLAEIVLRRDLTVELILLPCFWLIIRVQVWIHKHPICVTDQAV